MEFRVTKIRKKNKRFVLNEDKIDTTRDVMTIAKSARVILKRVVVSNEEENVSNGEENVIVPYVVCEQVREFDP